MNAEPPERKLVRRTRPATGTSDCVHRRDSGRGSHGAAQAAAHRASDLASYPGRAALSIRSRKSTVRRYVRETQTALGWATRKTVCRRATTGAGRPGRLVRGVGGVERRTSKAASIFAAQHGERRGLPSRVSSRHPASLSRSPRARISFLWRCLWSAELRQPQERGEKDPAGLSARGDGTLHRVSLALAVSERVLHAGAKRTRRAASRARPATSGATTGCRYRRRRIWRTSIAQLLAALSARTNSVDRRPTADYGGGDASQAAHLLPLAQQGFDLADVSFPRVDGLGMRQGANQPLLRSLAGRTVKSGSMRVGSRSGTKARCSRVMSAVTSAISRFSISNITSTCWSASRVRLSARSRWRQWRRAGAGRRVMIGCWHELIDRHGRQSGTRQMIQVLGSD